MRPDKTFLYGVDEGEALARATQDGHADRIEAEGAAFQRRLRAAYDGLRARSRGAFARSTVPAQSDKCSHGRKKPSRTA